jgi:hypothetical protein
MGLPSARWHRGIVLVVLIVAAEIAFWLALLAGLVTRYLLRRPRLGMALLVATPLIDLALLAATTIDLRRGGEGPCLTRWPRSTSASPSPGGSA